MIPSIIAFFTTSAIGRTLAKIGAVLALVGAALWKFASLIKRGERAKQSEAALNATVKGNAAARKGKTEAAEQLRQGKTPEEIVKGNDNAWR